MSKAKTEKTKDEPRYTVAAVLRSGLYEPWAVKACLKEGKLYTAEEIEKVITKFMKGAK